MWKTVGKPSTGRAHLNSFAWLHVEDMGQPAQGVTQLYHVEDCRNQVLVEITSLALSDSMLKTWTSPSKEPHSCVMWKTVGTKYR
jgi:hypothetical protein